MTHPIVEAGARAFHAIEHDNDQGSWDAACIDERTDYEELAVVTILAALREMRDGERIRETLMLRDGPTAITLEKVVRGYIDALIKEIEAS